MGEVLRAQDLHVHFYTKDGEVKAVNGVSFSLQEGSILCLVGESGAGKSTTALALLGLLPKAARVPSGSVYFDGLDLLSVDQQTLRRIRGKEISMIPQEPRAFLNPILTVGTQVEEQILAHTDLSKKAANRLALEMLRDMGLPDPKNILKQYPFQLSGGMCQRVMLSMALALRPRVLIADEPTSSLDVTLQAEILRRLKDTCRELNSSILLITHDMGIVAQMADEVAVMYAGSIVESADVQTLFRYPQHPYMYGLFQSLPRLDRPGRRFEPIRGNPPDLMNLPGQCPFLPRCPKAISKCRLEPTPILDEVGPGHKVACYNTLDYDWMDAEDEG